MSNDAKDALVYSFAAILVAVAIGIGIWVVGFTLNGIGNWWGGITKPYVLTPEDRAQNAKRDAEWAKDPRNPKVQGQKCLDLGGVPDFSAWDGDVKACNTLNGGNVDIKQTVEVNP